MDSWLSPHRRCRRGVGLVGLLVLAIGCGSDSTDPPGVVDVPPDVPYPTEPSPAILEIYGMDIWGQYLPDAAGSLTVEGVSNGVSLQVPTYPVARLALTVPGQYKISLTAADHHDISVIVAFDGSSSASGLIVDEEPAPGHGLSVSHDQRTIRDNDTRMVHTVYLGAPHKWFSSLARPARRGNRLELLMDGEEAWSRVASDIPKATDSIHLTTWWWQSRFELIRDPATSVALSVADRTKNTVLDMLDKSSATKRLIVGQFLGQDGVVSWINVDADLRARASATNDGFEMMGQANPTNGMFWFDAETYAYGERVRELHPHTEERPFDEEGQLTSTVIEARQIDLTQWPVGVSINHASYHQKFITMDDKLAYIGGMNYETVDWDSSEHKVFEPRRMKFERTENERQLVADKDALPDTPPRKDYILRVEGPSAQDAQEVFKMRWDDLRNIGATYAENASTFAVERQIPSLPDGAQVQVITTLPEPYWEHGIAEAFINAANNAERYIYIEDQYFRIPMLNAAIEARMNEVPGLELVVFTIAVNQGSDPGCYWTNEAYQRFLTGFPSRFHMFQPRSFDSTVTGAPDDTQGHFVDMYIHSKMMLVDDVFMTVGSANKNNRGIAYEGEMNAAVFDAAFVRDSRRRIIANLLPPGTPPSDDASVWIQQLINASLANDAAYAGWEAQDFALDLNGAPIPANLMPKGFVYGLSFGLPSDCGLQGVGPDQT